MSLVAYGSSDESDSEEINERQDVASFVVTDSVTSNETIGVSSSTHVLNGQKESHDNEKDNYDSFCKLKLTTSTLENSLKILDKNRSHPIRITIPSLDELKKNSEEEVKDHKNRNVNRKSTGLLALLAPPKNEPTNAFHSLNDSKKPKNTSAPLVPRNVIRPVHKKESKTIKKVEEDVDDWDCGNSFFFNSNEVEHIEFQPIEPELSEDVNIFKSVDKPILNQSYNEIPVSNMPSTSYDYSENETLSVDAEALEKLCGRSERKRGALDIQEQIIDVRADSLIGEANLWLTKDLTIDKPSSSKKIKSLSSVERRKHQITYLASQAKEKELELRNQWANNRMTKKQTQAKYGF